MIAPRWVLGLGRERVDEVEHESRQHAPVVEQVAPEEGGDLVVARPARPEPAADLGADLLDQQPLERAVHVLVGRGGLQRPDGVGRW